ncbi:alpha/beta fold hydrolase [Paraburkholderia tagetis]|uniref:Alpha/beta hydrolase n=1 Tax=Paraburkholderia tagetis TaxID=2913261 RepID=A0A9X1UL75_9BURK|nr:alpha/beta hydrolase [Paraburkholderia tagetis]MCG5077416.1 alpha/beta hydrolase [Paraburkholderia tagetis]
MTEPSAVPRQHDVQCLSPSGLHRMAYTEWGDPTNPRVLVCVHGLTRSGRDFDRLAAALCGTYRVVCPDVVGRGLSSWLVDPRGYGVAQYVADMVTLIARIGVGQVDWFGTSMGGLIGMALAGLPDAPIGRMLLNDIGPHIEPAALGRIGEYVGRDEYFGSLQEGIDNAALLAASFGPLTEQEWREINTPLLHEVDGAWRYRYDPRISEGFKGITPEQNEQGEQFLWRAFAAFKGPLLAVRGERSDLLSRETVARMVETGQQASSVEIAGVGHAPAFLAADQIEIARRFFDGGPVGGS